METSIKLLFFAINTRNREQEEHLITDLRRNRENRRNK